MNFLASLPYLKGLGDAAIAAIVVDKSTNKFLTDADTWNADRNDAKIFALPEWDFSDPTLSRYQNMLALPDQDNMAVHYILVSTGEYIAEDDIPGPVAPVTVNPAQLTGGVLQSIITIGDAVEWPRGDADRLTVGLGEAYAKDGARFYLCIKKNKGAENSAAIVNAEITITDAATVAGYIDLTADQMAVTGLYHAEIERRDADGTSNPKTCWRADWRIVQDVRR